ncbi:MAG: class I SAM-dependent methyltransferase [Armatimonadetes bacterium]|nr:class I SAM-dependent methyltransferase [Armatimonadota bacterium]MCX7969767.1 class I SAM-dependent methyltransferase [Armatimonadota bacterium]MDW8144044.1 class I SAM-dependent methyltransferase [Armatimonadota bacterium]
MPKSAQLFERLAERYDAWYDSGIGKVAFPIEVNCLQPLLDGLSKPWLEVGVGTGRFAQSLGVEVGIDPAFRPLQLARQRQVFAVQAFGENLPFRDSTFGAVLIVVTLCFADDPLSLLREVNRVLRDDGALVLGMVFADSPWGEFYMRKAELGHPFYSAAHFLTRHQTQNLLLQAGFKIVAAKSALRQPPSDENLLPEIPTDGDQQDAGFVAWKAVKVGVALDFSQSKK